MELYQLEYFRVLCKYGSYTSASLELNVSQPTISMAMKKLEKECGELIDHKSKSFALTPKGETLLTWAVVIHNDMENLLQAIGAFSARQREIVRFAFPMPLCPELMSNVLPVFSQHHSDVALNIIQAGHTAIASNLMSGAVDVGILCADMLTSALESRPYRDVEYWACFSKDHPFSQCSRVTPEMLAEETLIVPKLENSITKAIREYLPPDCKARILLEDIFPEDVWQLAYQGRGIAFMPKHSLSSNCAPLAPPLVTHLVVAWRREEKLTRQKQELIDYICQKS